MANSILAFLNVSPNHTNVLVLWDMFTAVVIVSTMFGFGYSLGFALGAARTARRIRQHLIARRIG